MVTWHRALGHLTGHSKTLIYPSCKGTESFWILEFLSGQAGLSVRQSRGTWPDTWICEVVRYWGFKRWSSNASLPVCFRLTVQDVRWCSYLARPCKVFHSWGSKTYDTLIGWSRDAWLESWRRSESGSVTGVGIYDRSHIFRLESGIRPKSHIRPKSWYICIISIYNG
jgi:hypothetical protein